MTEYLFLGERNPDFFWGKTILVVYFCYDLNTFSVKRHKIVHTMSCYVISRIKFLFKVNHLVI